MSSIFVTNLPTSVNDRFLSNLFSQYGEVLSTKIVKDKKTKISKGFAFIRMPERDIENALQHLNGFEVKGKKLVVQPDIAN